MKEADLVRADKWFDTYGPWMVLFGRMVPGVRSLVLIPLGSRRCPSGGSSS